MEDCQRDPASSSEGFHSFGLLASSPETGSIEAEITGRPVVVCMTVSSVGEKIRLFAA